MVRCEQCDDVATTNAGGADLCDTCCLEYMGEDALGSGTWNGLAELWEEDVVNSEGVLYV